MSISIIDSEICLTCKKETCAYIDVVTKNGTFFSSEGSVCPTGVLQTNPVMMPNSPFSKKECINCGLCVGYCSKSNLLITDTNEEIALENCSSIGLNAMVSNYLNKIFLFAANSNRNSCVHFDGYVEIDTEKEAFVEVDIKDSLECCRNLLGDFLLYKGQFDGDIDTGLIVLQEIPKKGSSNIFSVIEKMRLFPQLNEKQIFITTFSFLRYLFLTPNIECVEFARLFYNPLDETFETYRRRIRNDVGFTF